MTTARFGLIGYGAWGSHHARAIASVPGAELVAIAAHSQASCAKAAADHPAARVYADYCDMLAGEELDAVDVVLPSHLHHQAGRDVLLSGRHLLLEKPMCLDLARCDELIGLARDRNLVLAVGHELRVSSLWGRVKELIESGAVGEPLYALVELWRRPYRLGSDGWRYDIARVGDWILEEPIHFFDLARWYFAGAGDPPQLPTTSVVTPCSSVLSQYGFCSARRSEWEWQSIKPGLTACPAASISRAACACRRSPNATMRPPSMPTSARVHGLPVPSMTMPLRMSTSSIQILPSVAVR